MKIVLVIIYLFRKKIFKNCERTKYYSPSKVYRVG